VPAIYSSAGIGCALWGFKLGDDVETCWPWVALEPWHIAWAEGGDCEQGDSDDQWLSFTQVEAFVFPLLFRHCFIPVFLAHVVSSLAYPDLLGTKMLGCWCCCILYFSSRWATTLKIESCYLVKFFILDYLLGINNVDISRPGKGSQPTRCFTCPLSLYLTPFRPLLYLV
jgi:hypothetical protein